MLSDIIPPEKCGESLIKNNSYRPFFSKKFKKSWKKYSKSGKGDISKLQEVVDSLAQGIPLAYKHKDHQLQGNLRSLRECHITPDLLLIYSIDTDTNELNLVDLGTHSELFG